MKFNNFMIEHTETEFTGRLVQEETDKAVFFNTITTSAYIYTLEELVNLGEGFKQRPGRATPFNYPGPLEVKKYEAFRSGTLELIRILNSLQKWGRLTAERPGVDALRSAFKLVIEIGEETIAFADPHSFPPTQRAGINYSRERLEKFGRGNLEKAVNRLKIYLEDYYQRHGTIAGAVSSRARNGQIESTYRELLAWEKDNKELIKLTEESEAMARFDEEAGEPGNF
jgi:hypothetical protein